MTVITLGLVGFGKVEGIAFLKQAAYKKRIVADHLGGQTVAGLPAEPFVLGIETGMRLGDKRTLPVSPTRHDKPDRLLDAPVIIDEGHGKVVEQRTVGRRLPLTAEILQRRRQAFPEKQIPQPVGEDPGGQATRSVFGIGQPLRQIETIQTVGFPWMRTP